LERGRQKLKAGRQIVIWMIAVAIPFTILGALFWGMEGAAYGALIGALLGAGYRGLFIMAGQMAKSGFRGVDKSVVKIVFGVVMATTVWLVSGRVLIGTIVMAIAALYTWTKD
jgi:hypothetical protein